MSRRLLIAFFILVASVGAAFAQAAAGDTLRLGFFPPLGEDLVYRIEFSQEQASDGRTDRRRWSHEVVIHLTGKRPPDLLEGRFTLRNVVDQEGSAEDPYYLIASAIEGESFDLQMLEAGPPVVVDWAGIKQRVSERSAGLGGRTAAAMPQILPMFDPDGVTAVMRPLWVTGIAYLRAFARDGSTTTATGLDLPAFYPVKGAVLQSYGARLEGSDDLMFVWKITSDPKAASESLGREIQGIVRMLASGAGQADLGRQITEALAQGVEALEGGVAIYDLTPGLMREVTFDARLVAGPFRRDTRIVITRLAPE